MKVVQIIVMNARMKTCVPIVKENIIYILEMMLMGIKKIIAVKELKKENAILDGFTLMKHALLALKIVQFAQGTW